jgi:Rieske Fe-S protein
MERRDFLAACAGMTGAAALAASAAARDGVAPRHYGRTKLVDARHRPLRTADLKSETNYVFQYPYAATPCFLLRLAGPAPPVEGLKREDGRAYDWIGGVGAERRVVAFTAICAHQLAYPTREVSFIRYQSEGSATSAGRVIHCCADHSVYDPAAGARVVSGPAPQPLAAIVLEHDPKRDELYALGTLGAEPFEAFFAKYEFRLATEYGGSKARAGVGAVSVVRELSDYCRNTIRC